MITWESTFLPPWHLVPPSAASQQIIKASIESALLVDSQDLSLLRASGFTRRPRLRRCFCPHLRVPFRSPPSLATNSKASTRTSERWLPESYPGRQEVFGSQLQLHSATAIAAGACGRGRLASSFVDVVRGTFGCRRFQLGWHISRLPAAR